MQEYCRISRLFNERRLKFHRKTDFSLIEHSVRAVFVLSVGYEKDIFAVFAYEFELSQNDISLRDMIYGFAV